jgi:hypothetical protein
LSQPQPSHVRLQEDARLGQQLRRPIESESFSRSSAPVFLDGDLFPGHEYLDRCREARKIAIEINDAAN